MNTLQLAVTNWMDSHGERARSEPTPFLPKAERDKVNDDLSSAAFEYFKATGHSVEMRLLYRVLSPTPQMGDVSRALTHLQIAVAKMIAAHGIADNIDALVDLELQTNDAAHALEKPQDHTD